MHLSNRQLFLSHVAQTSPEPVGLEIVSAQGVYLHDVNNRRYMDLISGISVSNIGHCHPAVVEAVEKQVRTHMHLMVYGEYVQSPQVLLAETLVNILPPKLNTVYFVNSGSEANEGALKLAKRYTGRSEMISFHNCYHGSTHGALSMIGSEAFKTAYRPLLPDTKRLNFNNVNDLSEITERTACVLVEPIQSEAGVIAADEVWLKKLRDRCHALGALLIFDEVQTGFGRTGSLFAFEHYKITPDILVLGKGMGGGMPIGAFVSSAEIMHKLTYEPVLGHMTTFGGHPVCCAAALANVRVIVNENLQGRGKKIEKIIKKELKHETIKEIRARGALIAVDFASEAKNMAVIHECIQEGVITDWFLFNPWSMRIAPPLTITDDELRSAINTILKVLNKGK